LIYSAFDKTTAVSSLKCRSMNFEALQSSSRAGFVQTQVDVFLVETQFKGLKFHQPNTVPRTNLFGNLAGDTVFNARFGEPVSLTTDHRDKQAEDLSLLFLPLFSMRTSR